jgi:internalin A
MSCTFLFLVMMITNESAIANNKNLTRVIRYFYDSRCKATKTNMKSSLQFGVVPATILILSFQVSHVYAALSNNLSFEQWCLQKESLPVETKKTVDVMLKRAGTQDCKLADMNLNSLSTLSLNGTQTSDIKPLAGLTKLTELYLGDNKISDIKPLAGLTKLTYLYLGNNQISDIKPLASLTKLTELYLLSNKIANIKPLAGLAKLTYLGLSNNKINDKSCPIKHESVCNY